MRTSLLLVAWSLASLPVEAGAQDTTAAVAGHADSSMLAWSAAVADAIAGRLSDSQGARLRCRGERGVDPRKVESVFRAHVAAALAARDVETGAGVEVEVVVSLEGALVWAVGLVGTKPEQAFAVSWPVDRELEALLGARAVSAGGGRWRMERLGAVPAGVLDLIVTDLDDDGSDDIALLSVDGVRTLRFGLGDARPTPLGGPFPLPERAWPRVIAGRLARLGDELVLGTTAGHRLMMNPASGRSRPSGRGVPLVQPRDPARPSVLDGEYRRGGPDVTWEGGGEAAAGGFRDLQMVPGSDTWLWVDREGRLGGLDEEHGLWRHEDELFGDRLMLLELDGGGLPEIVTTGAAPLGEPDRITIHRLDGSPPRPSVLFRGTFAGTVRALGAGDLDFDGRPDIVFVEETGDDAAVLWRLERTP